MSEKQSERKKGPAPVRLGLYVTEERDRNYGDYYHVRASVVVIGPTRYEMQRIDQGERLSIDYERIRNVSDELHGGLFLNDLMVVSQGNSEDEPRKLYGWEVRYQNVHSIDLREATRMHMTLSLVERRMEKVEAKYGRAMSFGAYLARVAEAVGASAFVSQATKTGRGGWSYDDQPQRVRTISDGIYHVDNLVQTWVEEKARAEEERRRALSARQAEAEQQARDEAQFVAEAEPREEESA